MFDFTRCRRADGSHYGTAGICRKGSEDPLSEFKKLVRSRKTKLQDKLIGQGMYGKVYDIGNGVVVKRGKISGAEIEAMKVLEGVTEVPRVIAHELNPVKENMSILAMSKAPGIPVKRVKYEKQEATMDQFLPTLRKLHKNGVAHNDLHEGNIFVNSRKKEKTFSVIDFGSATMSTPANQIEDIKMVGVMSTTERNSTLDEIIYKHLGSTPYQDIFKWSNQKQQKLVNAVWDDIDQNILAS